MNKHPIILASASPRRFELLQQLGWQPQVHAVAIDESVAVGEAADAYCQRMALEKALAASAEISTDWPLLAADTTVVVDGVCLGKPKTPEHAVLTLQSLAERSHQVISAVAVQHQGTTGSALSQNVVHFGPMRLAEIERYVASGEPMDKAGAYGIQGRAAKWIKRIEGSYSAVMGLPLYETTQLLRKLNIMIP